MIFTKKTRVQEDPLLTAYKESLAEVWAAERFFNEATGEYVEEASFKLKAARLKVSNLHQSLRRGEDINVNTQVST